VTVTGQVPRPPLGSSYWPLTTEPSVGGAFFAAVILAVILGVCGLSAGWVFGITLPVFVFLVISVGWAKTHR